MSQTCSTVFPMSGQCPKGMNIQVEGWCCRNGTEVCMLHFSALGLSASTSVEHHQTSQTARPPSVSWFLDSGFASAPELAAESGFKKSTVSDCPQLPYYNALAQEVCCFF